MSNIFQEFFVYYFFLFFLQIKQNDALKSNACSLSIQDPRIAFEDIDASELYPCVMFYSGTPGEKVKFDKHLLGIWTTCIHIKSFSTLAQSLCYMYLMWHIGFRHWTQFTDILHVHIILQVFFLSRLCNI